MLVRDMYAMHAFCVLWLAVVTQAYLLSRMMM